LLDPCTAMTSWYSEEPDLGMEQGVLHERDFDLHSPGSEQPGQTLQRVLLKQVGGNDQFLDDLACNALDRLTPSSIAARSSRLKSGLMINRKLFFDLEM